MTAPNVQQPTPPNATASAPTSPPPGAAPSTPTSGAPPAPLAAPEARYPADAGYLAGKTLKEAAELMNQLYAQNQRLSGTPTSAAAPQAAPAAALQVPTSQDFLERPAEATQAYMAYLKQTEFNPVVQRQDAALAQTNRRLAEFENKDEFKRWAPEIDLALQQFGPEAWTPSNIKLVVDMVRGRHASEIAEEMAETRAQARLAQLVGGAGLSLRPDGGLAGGTSVMPSNTVDFTKLPPQYSALLSRLNLTQQTVDEFLTRTKVKSQGISLDKAREEWIAQAQRGDIITDGKEITGGIYV